MSLYINCIIVYTKQQNNSYDSISQDVYLNQGMQVKYYYDKYFWTQMREINGCWNKSNEKICMLFQMSLKKTIQIQQIQNKYNNKYTLIRFWLQYLLYLFILIFYRYK